MRFDALYVLSSLWAPANPSPVCPSLPAMAAGIVLERGLAAGDNAVTAVTAFVDVNVVPMDTERVLAHHTVLVEDGRITALGPVEKVPVPAGATRIDGRGKYLMPGLGEMHVHSPDDVFSYGGISEEYGKFRMVSMGITAVRTLAEGGVGVSVEKMQSLRQHFMDAESPSPRLYLARAFRPSTPPESLTTYVAAAKAAGYDHIGVPYLDNPSSEERVFLDSVIAAAKRVSLPVSAHTHELPLDAVLALGAAGGAIDHISTLVRVLEYSIPWDLRNHGDTSAFVDVPMPKVRELAAAMQRAGVWFVPTLACQEFVKNVPIKNQGAIVKALHDAGVKLLLAGDEANVHLDLAALVRAGLSPYEALLTGTRNVAEYFHRLDDLGTVALGKRADLVLLHGNPLENIGHVWEPAAVMIEGRWLDRAALDQGLFTLSKKGAWNWVVSEMYGLASENVVHRLTDGQRPAFSTHMKQLFSLGRLLDVVPSSERMEGVLRQIADEFGAMRAVLTPEQRMAFDPLVRMWLREQARKGYQLTVPGVMAIS